MLLDGALAAAFAAPVRTVTVVTGADPASPGGSHFRRPGAGRSCAAIVHAADHAEGMAAILRAGIASLPADAAGAFVFLGDMPLIPRDVPFRLALALAGEALAGAPVFEDRRGHPVLFSAVLFDELSALQGDNGAREVLEGLGERLALIEAPDGGVLYDVDAPEDLVRPAQS